MDKTTAGHLLSLAAVGMIVGSPLLSQLSDEVFPGPWPIMILSGLGAVVLTGLLAWFPGRLPAWLIYVFCFGLGLCTNAIVVIGFSAAKELFSVQIAGTSTGLVNLFPFLGGAA